MRDALILFPFGGNAREAVTAIDAVNAVAFRHRILGYLDDNCHRLQSADFPILGTSERWQEYRGSARLLVVPGSSRSYLRRRELVNRFQLGPDDAVTIVDPSVRMASSASIGINCLVMAGCFVSTGVRIGDHCVVLPNTVLSHDACLRDHVIVGSNVSISGGVELGENCYIGSGARIREGIRIGAGALVGLGSVVVKDVPAGAVVAGVPARTNFAG